MDIPLCVWEIFVCDVMWHFKECLYESFCLWCHFVYEVMWLLDQCCYERFLCMLSCDIFLINAVNMSDFCQWCHVTFWSVLLWKIFVVYNAMWYFYQYGYERFCEWNHVTFSSMMSCDIFNHDVIMQNTLWYNVI